MIEGAMLALVGLLLAFTVSMAEGRFDTAERPLSKKPTPSGRRPCGPAFSPSLKKAL